MKDTDSKPYVHSHVTIGGHEFLTSEGHLFEARCGDGTEVFIETLSLPLPRMLCEAAGLARL